MSKPADHSHPDPSELRIGISSCLLGQNVRYDGGHKRDDFLTGTLASLVRFVPVCPEVELGLGTPRETIRLIKTKAGPRLVAPKSGADHTDAMRAFSAARVEALTGLDLSGYVLKKDSPSCGMERVKVYEPDRVPAKTGRGVFAEALLQRLPFLPVEEEGRLQDPRLRDNFFERVFAYRRLRGLQDGGATRGDLVRFHTREKLLLLAHEPRLYQELGRLVAALKGRPMQAVLTDYSEGFMTCLKRPATPRKHTNVLQHIAGYFKKSLDARDKAELAAVIEEYRQGLLPLIVPLTLARHHVRRLEVAYLADQTYLDPHPKELMLRNHV